MQDQLLSEIPALSEDSPGLESNVGRTVSQQLRLMVEQRDWCGTIADLAALLADSGIAALPAPHLGRWLRRNEPTLWWDYGVTVTFSRSGYERLLQLSRRGAHTASAFR
jgi:hypothetical protein